MLLDEGMSSRTTEGCECHTSFQSSANILTQQIESLRDVVGDYGIALFVPLLDFDHSNNKDSSIPPSFKMKETLTTSSSCTTIATQTECESDQYRSDDDENDAEQSTNDEQSVRIVHESLPLINACPPILSKQQMQYIQHYLPNSIRDSKWERRFVIGLHGDSFCTLLQKCEGYKNTIVVIRTTSNQILGGFASDEWKICSSDTSFSTHQRNRYRTTQHSYYGTGQSFVFGSNGLDNNQHQFNTTIIESCDGTTTLRVYPWTGQNDYCQICDVDKSILCMGGVGDFGWIVSDNFTLGQTGSCATYNNPPLIDDTSFCIADFEVYGLVSPLAQFM